MFPPSNGVVADAFKKLRFEGLIGVLKKNLNPPRE